MIIYCFSSEDFRPKRLIYMAPPKKPGAESAEGATGETSTDAARKAKEAREAAIKRGTRTVIYRVKQKVEDDVADKYKKKEKDIKGFIRGIEKYPPSGWRAWNRRFAKELGGEKVNPDQQVRAIQQIVFKELGIENDPGAKVDGKMGPYTMAALARYAKIKIPLNVPKGNKLLDAKVAELARETEKAEKEKAEKEAAKEADRSKKMAAIEAAKNAGNYDPKKSYLKKKGDDYEVVNWEPLERLVPRDVAQDNQQINTLKPGEETTFEVGGEQVKVRCTASVAGINKYSVDGAGDYPLAEMYRKVIEVANDNRNKKIPDGPKAADVLKAQQPDKLKEIAYKAATLVASSVSGFFGFGMSAAVPQVFQLKEVLINSDEAPTPEPTVPPSTVEQVCRANLPWPWSPQENAAISYREQEVDRFFAQYQPTRSSGGV